jgi:hypothetical protein
LSFKLVLAALFPTGLDCFYNRAGLAAMQVRLWCEEGAVAQLGERLICIQEVAGSIPTSSTSFRFRMLVGAISFSR